MNWDVVLFIALPLFFIIGNIMMVKHTAKMKMPSLKDRMPDQNEQAEKPQSSENHDDDTMR